MADAGAKGGVLYVVATPIGNLEDLSARARRVLCEVELIAAEDTRHTRRLLSHHGISAKLIACHEHNEQRCAAAIVARLAAGGDVALVSDAGTPAVSDPGYVVVRDVARAGLRVVPVPGPSAVLAALCASGLPSDRFVFEGFLPARAAARRKRLAALATESRTLVVYEACHRIVESLDDMVHAFGAGREAVLARELTKRFETLVRGGLGEIRAQVAADPDHARGEIVLVVAGAPPREDMSNDAERVLDVLLDELGAARAATLAARITGASRNSLYRLALERRTRREEC